MFFKKNGIKIPLETVQNVYESIPRRIVSVVKAKVGPTPN
jgi:hypothetical protein